MFNSMTQSYYDLAQSVQELQQLLVVQGGGVAIQKIFSSAHFITLALRFRGFNKFVYLGRGKEFEGLFLGDKNVSAEHRLQDSFLQFLRAHLRGGILLNVELDKVDRAVIFNYIIGKKPSALLFFWRGRELFFIFAEKQLDRYWKVTPSWQRSSQQIELDDSTELFLLFDEVGRKTLRSYNKSNNCNTVEDYFEFLDSGLQVETSKKIRKLKRKIENIKSDIIKFERWKKVYQDVIADKYPLSELSFNQDGIKIKFQSEQSYFHRKSNLLDKLKRAVEYQRMAHERLHVSSERLAQFQGKKRASNLQIVFNPMTHVFNSNKPAVVKKQSVLGVKFFKCSEGTLAVGTSASANDYIRSKWSSKNDYWFHLDGDHSAHAIWKGHSDGRPSLEIIKMAASAVLELSGFNSSEVNIIYTQVKNIKPVKNSPGKVLYKKEKHLRVDFYAGWQENCS